MTAITLLRAQTMDTVLIVQKAKKFKPGEHIKLMFEVLDTVDAFGKTVSFSRSYYFDKKHRTISSVREYHNPRKPKKGTQVIYDFVKNKLATVTVILPKSACRNCASEYYFVGDSLLLKKETVYTNPDPIAFVKQAHYFQSKLPSHLPWGYFEDEVMVNGKQKRLRQGY